MAYCRRMNILNLSSKQMREAANLKDQIDRLQARLNGLAGNSVPAKAARRKRRTMSAAGRAAIAAAQKARWAKIKGAKK